jgi:hypothetical protein
VSDRTITTASASFRPSVWACGTKGMTARFRILPADGCQIWQQLLATAKRIGAFGRRVCILTDQLLDGRA